MRESYLEKEIFYIKQTVEVSESLNGMDVPATFSRQTA